MSSSIRLTGRLARDARPFTSTDGGAWMELLVDLDPGRAEALVRMGAGAAAQAVCATAARRYRKGETVTVWASGFSAGHPEIVLVGIERVELIPIGLDRLTPEREEIAA